MTDVSVKLKLVPMASTGTLINKVGLISGSTGSTEGQEESHHAGFWYCNCKLFFFFLSFFSWWVSDLYISYRMRFKWLFACVCLWSKLFRTGWKVKILGFGVSFVRYCPLGRFTSHSLSRRSRLDRLSPRELWPEESRRKKTEPGTKKKKGKYTECQT